MAKDNNIPDDGLRARVVDLTRLIGYQDGAVVSRTLIKRPTGTVTLFALDDGQELSEHTSPFDALVQVLDGTLELLIGGVDVRVSEGEIVRMPANVPHALHAPGPARMVLTMLREKVEE